MLGRQLARLGEQQVSTDGPPIGFFVAKCALVQMSASHGGRGGRYV